MNTRQSTLNEKEYDKQILGLHQWSTHATDDWIARYSMERPTLHASTILRGLCLFQRAPAEIVVAFAHVKNIKLLTIVQGLDWSLVYNKGTLHCTYPPIKEAYSAFQEDPLQRRGIVLNLHPLAMLILDKHVIEDEDIIKTHLVSMTLFGVTNLPIIQKTSIVLCSHRRFFDVMPGIPFNATAMGRIVATGVLQLACQETISMNHILKKLSSWVNLMHVQGDIKLAYEHIHTLAQATADGIQMVVDLSYNINFNAVARVLCGVANTQAGVRYALRGALYMVDTEKLPDKLPVHTMLCHESALHMVLPRDLVINMWDITGCTLFFFALITTTGNFILPVPRESSLRIALLTIATVLRSMCHRTDCPAGIPRETIFAVPMEDMIVFVNGRPIHWYKFDGRRADTLSRTMLWEWTEGNYPMPYAVVSIISDYVHFEEYVEHMPQQSVFDMSLSTFTHPNGKLRNGTIMHYADTLEAAFALHPRLSPISWTMSSPHGAVLSRQNFVDAAPTAIPLLRDFMGDRKLTVDARYIATEQFYRASVTICIDVFGATFVFENMETVSAVLTAGYSFDFMMECALCGLYDALSEHMGQTFTCDPRHLEQWITRHNTIDVFSLFNPLMHDVEDRSRGRKLPLNVKLAMRVRFVATVLPVSADFTSELSMLDAILAHSVTLLMPDHTDSTPVDYTRQLVLDFQGTYVLVLVDTGGWANEATKMMALQLRAEPIESRMLPLPMLDMHSTNLRIGTGVRPPDWLHTLLNLSLGEFEAMFGRLTLFLLQTADINGTLHSANNVPRTPAWLHTFQPNHINPSPPLDMCERPLECIVQVVGRSTNIIVTEQSDPQIDADAFYRTYAFAMGDTPANVLMKHRIRTYMTLTVSKFTVRDTVVAYDHPTIPLRIARCPRYVDTRVAMNELSIMSYDWLMTKCLTEVIEHDDGDEWFDLPTFFNDDLDFPCPPSSTFAYFVHRADYLRLLSRCGVTVLLEDLGLEALCLRSDVESPSSQDCLFKKLLSHFPACLSRCMDTILIPYGTPPPVLFMALHVQRFKCSCMLCGNNDYQSPTWEFGAHLSSLYQDQYFMRAAESMMWLIAPTEPPTLFLAKPSLFTAFISQIMTFFPSDVVTLLSLPTWKPTDVGPLKAYIYPFVSVQILEHDNKINPLESDGMRLRHSVRSDMHLKFMYAKHDARHVRRGDVNIVLRGDRGVNKRVCRGV